MEDTLKGEIKACERGFHACLNPCFNGRYSQSRETIILLSSTIVLILVLMEDTLRVMAESGYQRFTTVLILVLMEDTLRGNFEYSDVKLPEVLILVLMEDTLRVSIK